ncbi:MAG: NTP transferase domain-containing protein [Anaerolineae bacterium]|nr:NTP transferase domain-containing protein [Anaerolineae bacterium]
MDNTEIPVVILCGGMGTRMGNKDIPKPLVEVGGRPILWHVMKIYATQGFTKFILALGYRGDLIKRYFLEYEWLSRDFTLSLGNGGPVYHTPHDAANWQITFVETGLHTQTGARIHKVAPYITGPRFFATYADGVADIDLSALLNFHQDKGLLATMTGVQSFSRFGVVETDNEDRVTAYTEKPLEKRIINGGFFVFEQDALRYFAGDDDLILEQEPLRNLSADRQLALYKHPGFWRAMDTFKDVRQMNALWASDAPWKIW